MEKDALIEAYYRHGRFPADRGAHKTPEGRIVRGAGHIETEIKSNYWYEFLQIFAPVGLLALVLYMFYNALPQTYAKSLNKQNIIKKAEQLQRSQINLEKPPLLTHPASNASTDQGSLLAKAMTIYTDLSNSSVVQKVVQLPELSSKGLKNEITKHQPAIDTILTQKNALQDLKTKFPAPRAQLPPSKARNQVIKNPNGNALKGDHAKVPQQKSDQRQTEMPASKAAAVLELSSQKIRPANPVATKPSPVKAKLPKQTAKQSEPLKLLNNKPQVQSTPAPKLQSKPKPAKL